MTEVAEAEALILARMPRWPGVRIPILDSVGRVLAEEVLAERDQPAFDRVTMDGIALAYDDWASGQRSFEIVGTQAAGAPAQGITAKGQCIQTMTGAMLPNGCDTVIPVERLQQTENMVAVDEDADVVRRRFIHAQGSDRKQGDPVLETGLTIGPNEIAVLANSGCAEVAVTSLPRVAVISTGDELVGPAEPLEAYQIRSTNDYAIEASLCRANLAEVTRVRIKDDEQQLLDTLNDLHQGQDVLILSGGVSMGQFDFVPSVLAQLGAKLVFHRIDQRPGRPMWFGVSRDSKPIFALPGNPVSALVCLARYVLPALRQAAGLNPSPVERAVLAETIDAPKNLSYFMPVKLSWSEQGTQIATANPTNTSGDFISLAATDGFIELEKGPSERPKGSVARLFRW